MTKLTIAIIGPGRAGAALARAFPAAGYPVAAIYDRHPEAAQPLANELQAPLTQTPAGAVDLAEFTLLAVPDDAIAPLAQEIAEYQCSSAGKSVVHLSGVHDRTPLIPLKQAGLRTGVFHPIQTFPAGAVAIHNLKGTLFGVDADPPLRATLELMARDLDGEPFHLEGIDRTSYHLAAVLVANFSLTLLAEASALMEQAGLQPPTAKQALLGLLTGTLNNLRDTTPQDALTGPAVRGDALTIQRHLDALKSDPDLEQIYRRLTDRTIRLAQQAGRLTPSQVDSLRTILLEAV